MGAHSKRGFRPKRHTAPNARNKHNASNYTDKASEGAGISAAPSCVAKLYAARWEEMEEGCMNIISFALQPQAHATLLSHGVPQRLAELLLAAEPANPHVQLSSRQEGEGQAEEEGEAELNADARQVITRRGLLHIKSAAAGALRNMIVSGSDDVVVDTLAGATISTCALSQKQGAGNEKGSNSNNNGRGEPNLTTPLETKDERVNFCEGLVKLLIDTWESATESRRRGITSYSAIVNRRLGGAGTDTIAEYDDGNDNNAADANSCKSIIASADLDNMPPFSLLRALEEILQLIAVCVEGNEQIANAFSTAHAAKSLLCVIEAATGAAWEALQPQQQSVEPPLSHSFGSNEEEALVWIQHYRRREAEIFAAVAVAGSEVLHVLSGENEALSTLLLSAEAMAPHQSFLTAALDAEQAKAWLEAEVCSLKTALASARGTGANANVMEEIESCGTEDALILSVTRHNVLYQLCEVSLHVQGTLMNTSPTSVNAARVLPLVVTVLNAHPPHDEWSRTVPLLMQTCTLSEGVRTYYLARAQHRLRCVQAAVHVLHVVVDVICSLNEPNVDDEVAFRQNEAAKLLYSNNAMFVVGKLMRDALRMPTTTSDETGAGDVNNASCSAGIGGNCATTTFAAVQQQHEEDVVVEQALRAAAGTSGSGSLITKLQRLVLSNEVGVWGLANTLLLMVGWKDLGDAPSSIWRAIINALERRAQLLSREVQEDTSEAGVITPAHSPSSYSSSGKAKGVYLLLLQLESLVQMLWTLQRKQTAEAGGPLQVVNHLSARPADVDIVTRLAWEPAASTQQRQACVGVACSVCASLHTTEATEAAARFALGALQAEKLNPQAGRAAPVEINCPPPPGPREERRRWLMNFTKADGEWRVRCEAANQIMDLFLDEQHHETVYLPLRIQQALVLFIQQFQAYSKRRSQQQRDMMRNYKVVLPDFDEEGNLSEVVENLSAFVDYKKQFMR
ncbi:uncharacterized protein TEOVI_000529200 [Trypanosoma equiperdum]|uniref:Uncharacterized protein n=2 Tax=Trypanozoon TaxID=39700 RepID=Q57XS5_TRYB2|nr:hypothetical protein, conserved [Trypanosoma brucei brucei TREU927]AAX69594.1 hypothetical protein, conserved [Trypanosoma brucei]AAZ12766.1 hypothetical protein, conserved [Trypanosoma brucei brucei TREU927]SCU64530.1 hypothetical protein, conserved [Trypanosoma equiperdum]